MTSVVQGAASLIYLTAARSTARILATSPIIESVFAHRSVATGEVAFGRSDIDLLAVIRQEDAHDGPALAELYRKVKICRCLDPAFTHMEVHDPVGLQNWLETDTSRGSLERRSALLLHGRPVPMPHRRVRADHAVRRFAAGIETLLSPAVQQRNRRNLRKAVLDSWSEYATACGLIDEPCLTRGEAELRCRAAGDCVKFDGLSGIPQQAAAQVFDLASRLHSQLLPELQPLSRPIVFETRMPPRYRPRTFVILPDAGSLDTSTTLPGNVFLGTPRSLDLFLHYVDAFLYWTLPQELLEIGIGPPSVREFVRSCRFYSQGVYLRHPGFVGQVSFTPVTTTVSVAHALGWLSRGELPPPLPEGQVREATAAAVSCSDYYREIYSRLYRENEEIWRLLATLCGSSSAPIP